jgi:hypothetical protein
MKINYTIPKLVVANLFLLIANLSCCFAEPAPKEEQSDFDVDEAISIWYTEQEKSRHILQEMTGKKFEVVWTGVKPARIFKMQSNAVEFIENSEILGRPVSGSVVKIWRKTQIEAARTLRKILGKDDGKLIDGLGNKELIAIQEADLKECFAIMGYKWEQVAILPGDE